MKIYVASDHAGFTLKETLSLSLQAQGHTVEDCGALTLNVEDDYPDFVRGCAEKVAKDAGSFGVVIGASGQGEAMVANRVPGVRAVVYYGQTPNTQMDSTGESLDIISGGRIHNNANILSLGARFLSEDDAVKAVERFLSTGFRGEERHVRRIHKIDSVA